MLNPLANVAIYGFVFGVLFGATAPRGQNSDLQSFALFMLCALLPWTFFSLCMTLGLGAMTNNSALVRRVAFTREILVFSNVAHAIVQFLIELALLSIILGLAGSPVLVHLPVTLVLIVLLAVFATGLSLALSVLCVFFKDLAYLWAIVTQVWFFLTPIVYSPTLLEDNLPNWSQRLIKMNPMVHFVAAFRDSLYHGQLPGVSRLVTLMISSVFSLLAGWAVFLRMSRRLPEEV